MERDKTDTDFPPQNYIGSFVSVQFIAIKFQNKFSPGYWKCDLSNDACHATKIYYVEQKASRLWT